jgi:hypothetical protein
VAGENRGLYALSIVGSFSLLPWLESGADSVAPNVCHLVRSAARASPAARHGDATSVIARPPPLQMGQQLWSLLGCGPSAASQRGYAMADRQIHPFDKGGVELSIEAQSL